MQDNKYNEGISEWYDLVVTKGYNKKTVAQGTDALVAVFGNRRKILDVGIGTGLFAEPLVERGFEITGHDSSGPMLEIARRRLGTKIRLELQDILELDLQETYDAALSRAGVWVVEGENRNLVSHIIGYDENVEGFKKIADHLNPGGLFAITIGPKQQNNSIDLVDHGAVYSQKIVPGEDGTFEKKYFVRPMGSDGKAEGGRLLASMQNIYQRFSASQAQEIAEAAGFRPLEHGNAESLVVYQKK